MKYLLSTLLMLQLISNLALAIADDGVSQQLDTTKAAQCGDLLPNGTRLACLEKAVAKQLEKSIEKVEEKRAQGSTVMTITQIFGQILANGLPQGFVPVFENVKPGFYIQEFVLKGETATNWSQMITVAGSKGLSSLPNLTPEKYASTIAAGFKNVCPNTFSTASFGAVKVDGYDAFKAIAGCGEVPTSAGKVSEMLVMVTIKGEADYYSIQWSERGFPSSSPLTIDKSMWDERVTKLMPVKLCAIVPGEQKPYPSCTSQIKK